MIDESNDNRRAVILRAARKGMGLFTVHRTRSSKEWVRRICNQFVRDGIFRVYECNRKQATYVLTQKGRRA
jgi:hypothetical protein